VKAETCPERKEGPLRGAWAASRPDTMTTADLIATAIGHLCIMGFCVWVFVWAVFYADRKPADE
jgi:hypothetical protein